jgi:hypothetical protein
VRRVIDDVLDDLLPSMPAVLLDGPKAVGKTATALQRARTVWRLSRPAQASVVAADPQQALDTPPPVLLDEYQRVLTVFDAVVLTTGPAAYRRPDGIAVVPLGLLGP